MTLQALGSAAGTGIGAYYGGTAGASIGGSLGGAIGGLFGGSTNSAKAVQDQLNLGIMTQAVNVEQAREAMRWSEGQAGETRSFNSLEAEKQRQWQMDLANSAHQREQADLIKAGLNPILTATGGPGSTTPSGSTASSSNPGASQAHVVHPYDSYAGDIISAKRLDEVEKVKTSLEAARSIADISKTLAETKNLPIAGEAVAASGRLDVARELDTQRAIKLKELEITNNPIAVRKIWAEIDQINEKIKNLPSEKALNEASANERLTQSSTNSAQKLLFNATEALHRWTVEKEPSAKIKQWTGAAKDIGDAASSINPIRFLLGR